MLRALGIGLVWGLGFAVCGLVRTLVSQGLMFPTLVEGERERF